MLPVSAALSLSAIQPLQAPQPALHGKALEPLTTSMLATAPPRNKSRCWENSRSVHPNNAFKPIGKTTRTGKSELLHMPESTESLHSKVDQALAVLPFLMLRKKLPRR